MDKIRLKNVVEAILVASDRILNVNQIEKMLTEKDRAKPDVNEAERASANDEPAVEANDSTTEDSASEQVVDQVETEATESDDAEAKSVEPNDSSSDDEPVDSNSVDESEETMSLKRSIKEAIENLQNDYSGRAMELKEVASGFRFQVRQDYADYVAKLWEERPSKYSRALLETLVLIAYRQPITRGEIEAIRGVSVSSHIVKTLIEREWIRVIGHRDVPGKPAIFGSTKEFLDYFNLKSLDELPSLAEIKDFDKIVPELALEEAISAETERPEGDEPEAVDAVGTVDTETTGQGNADDDSITEESVDSEEETAENDSDSSAASLESESNEAELS